MAVRYSGVRESRQNREMIRLDKKPKIMNFFSWKICDMMNHITSIGINNSSQLRYGLEASRLSVKNFLIFLWIHSVSVTSDSL